MKVSQYNLFTRKCHKLNQTSNDVITISPGSTGEITIDEGTAKFLNKNSIIQFVNSVVNKTQGLSVGNGLTECQFGIWSYVNDSGFIKFDLVDDTVVYDYRGNYEIEIGEFVLVYSCIDQSKFQTPIDFTTPITIPPVSVHTVDISDGTTYPMGEYFKVAEGGGRINTVLVDMIKDERKDPSARTPYIYQRSTSSGTNQSIMYNNAVYNSPAYTLTDGIGTVQTTTGFTGVRFQIIATLSNWELYLMLATNGSGETGVIDNKVDSSGTPASESLVFRISTF